MFTRILIKCYFKGIYFYFTATAMVLQLTLPRMNPHRSLVTLPLIPTVKKIVIWCFVTEDTSTDAPLNSDHILTKSTSAGVYTSDETVNMSRGTPASSTGNTYSLSVGPTVIAGIKRR